MGDSGNGAATAIGEPLGHERVGFDNHIMFREVLKDDHELCRQFLERVLGFPIERVEEKHFEYPINPSLQSRGARFDLYVKGSGRVIDVEMQSSPAPSLGRRLRYYQGTLDVSLVRQPLDYRRLPESYIIFTCRHDPFALGLPRYTIEPTCRERPEAALGADLHWLVLNAQAFRLEEEPGLRSLLSYIENGTVDAADPLVVGLDGKVDELNRSEEVMAMIWTDQDEIELQAELAAEKAFAEGEAAGKAEGEALYARLAAALAKAGRAADLERAADDIPFRQSLLEEFAIA